MKTNLKIDAEECPGKIIRFRSRKRKAARMIPGVLERAIGIVAAAAGLGLIICGMAMDSRNYESVVKTAVCCILVLAACAATWQITEDL